MAEEKKAYFHLPGLFGAYEFYRRFLPLFREHREYFYDPVGIGSIYGAPSDCIWGGGRVGEGDEDPRSVRTLLREYGISARLTLSNSLIREEHLSDRPANRLCSLFAAEGPVRNGIIIHSELLLRYLKETYPAFYFVSSTTKVLTAFEAFRKEAVREEFSYVVPDFRLNRAFDSWQTLSPALRKKTEFLCNECCPPGCFDRYRCYENVSRKNLGEECADHVCVSPDAQEGYRFSKAMENPCFISPEDIRDIYLPMGFSHFKIEGRGLGSALLLEFILYYMTKPEARLRVREALYLDSMLDLF